MDFDRVGRRVALAALPLLAVAVYFAPRPDPAAETAPSASALPPPAGIGIPASELSPAAQALRERGEAALARTPPKAETSRAQTPPQQTSRAQAPSDETPRAQTPPHAPREPSRSVHTQSARDLPLAQAEDTPNPRRAGARREVTPLGPCGGVTVRGITDSPDPEWAFAMLAPMPTDSARISRVGDRIASYRVQSIEWDRVWLSGGAGRCAVRLAEGVREAAEAVGDPIDVDPASPATSEPWRLSRELRLAIEVSATRVRVEPGVLDALFERGPTWIAGMAVKPRREDERVIGVSFEGVKEGSLLHHVGIRSGDLLRRLDDAPAESLERIGQALLGARKAGKLLLELDRGSERIHILVEVA